MDNLPGDIVDLSAATTAAISLPLLAENKLLLDVLRLDSIHAVISGNKWFKLKYHLETTVRKHCPGIISFGGAYSNHIVALAFAANRLNLPSVGIIRGEKPRVLSLTLQDAVRYGMRLHFVSRDDYGRGTASPVIGAILSQYPGYHLVEEGGAGPEGVRGAGEILNLADAAQYTHIACAVGTGTMLAGIAARAGAGQKVIGIPVLKGFENWRPPTPAENISIIPDYHLGGYARKNRELFHFMNKFYGDTGIPTDFVYSGKLFYALLDMAEKGYFPRYSRILAIHCGGLQGNRSLPKGTLLFD